MINDKDYLRILLFSLIMFLITLGALVLPIIAGPDAEGLISTLMFFLTFILFWVTVAIFLSWEGKGESIEKLGLEWDNKTIPHIMIGAIVGILASGLVFIFAAFFGGDLRPVAEITGDLIVAEVIITAPVAFFEELTYRGYLMTRMEGLFGKELAIVSSAIIFSLLHFAWWTRLSGSELYLILIFTFNMFLGGVVLGYGYYLSGRKLWVPIAFHFTWNIIAYILFPSFTRDPVTNPGIFQIEWGVTTIPGFLFGLSLFYLLLNEIKRRKK